MLKKYSQIDLTFFAFCSVFVGLSAFELIRYIIPLYTYPKAILSIVLIAILYGVYNVVFQSTGLVKKRTVNTGDVAVIDTSGIQNPVVKTIFEGYNTSLKHKDILVYTSFIVIALLLLASQIVNITVLTVYSIIAFTLIYLYARIIGFKLDTNIRRSSLRSFNTLRFFTILYAVFFVILSYLIDIFEVPAEDKSYIFIGASLLYITSGAIIFFDISKIFTGVNGFVIQRLLRPYPIFMTILILGLSGYLIAKNNLVDQIGEGVVAVSQTVEETTGIVLPGLDPLETPDQGQDVVEDDIQYETVLVGEQYNIDAGLQVGSTGQSVVLLQTVLGNLQYFIGEVNGDFGEDTQTALIEALRSECAWPDTTRGIFGPQAKECIDSLEISRRVPEIQPQDLETPADQQEELIIN